MESERCLIKIGEKAAFGAMKRVVAIHLEGILVARSPYQASNLVQSRPSALKYPFTLVIIAVADTTKTEVH